MITWSLVGTDKIRMSADTSCGYERLERVRAEVRADARALATSLKRPVTVLDVLDQVQELVEPEKPMHPGLRASIESVTGRELPVLEVDDDEPGITRDRVMR